jgi:hypothetical protein
LDILRSGLCERRRFPIEFERVTDIVEDHVVVL